MPESTSEVLAGELVVLLGDANRGVGQAVLSGSVRLRRDDELRDDQGIIIACAKAGMGSRRGFDVLDGKGDEVGGAMVYVDAV